MAALLLLIIFYNIELRQLDCLTHGISRAKSYVNVLNTWARSARHLPLSLCSLNLLPFLALYSFTTLAIS